MKRMVISQPMYFPWVGLFEQIALADVFVFYDDVQFARGFINRVQYKSPFGTKWLTVPLCKHPRDTMICDLQVKEDVDWRKNHLDNLKNALNKTPFVDDALGLAHETLYETETTFVEMLTGGITRICRYFSIGEKCDFYKSSDLGIDGYKGERIKNLVKHFSADQYVTGLGGLSYLDHESFDQDGIEVRYMDYQKKEYPQRFGEFTPFVTILDLIANCGPEGRDRMCSGSLHWRDVC